MLHADIGLYLPMLAKVKLLQGNSAIYIAFLVAAMASAVPCVFLMTSVFNKQEEQASKTWSAIFFVFGLMFVMAGLFIYQILGSYGRPAAIVHGIGVGMILAMLLVGQFKFRNAVSGQSLFFDTFSVVVVAAALALTAGANYLAFQKNKKFDFNKAKLESLDNQTVKKLKALEEPVEVLAFVTKQERTQVPQIKEFFEKYQSINRAMFKVRFVNPLNEPGLASCYGVREGKGGKLNAQVLIARGTCVKDGKDGLKFKGKKLNITKLSEEHVTNRMIRVTRKQEKKICFLEGRKQPATSGQKDKNGFHFFKQVLEGKGFKSMTVNLLNKDEVPKECSVIVNAAPEYLSLRADSYDHTARLSDQEVDKIERYLDKGGKMMLFLEPRVNTGLGDTIKKKYGIEWRKGLTLEFRKNVGRPEVFFSSTFDDKQTITKGFSKGGVRVYFLNATALKTSNVAGVTVKEVVKTDQIKIPGMKRDRKTGRIVRVALKCCSFFIPNPSGMRFRYLQREYVKIRPRLMARKAATGFVERIVPDAKREPVALVVAASKKSTTAGKETRVVVFADSFPASNRGIRFQGYGNVTLAVNSVAWLVSEKDLVALPPKNRKVKKLALTALSRNSIQYTTRYAMPVFFFFIILLVMAIQRQK